ncbi:MAG TPA: DUF5818 domain-containing protein [Candidatus Baltobacteraceae bacterium]|jgi:hypothetical protein|nr:DUF5818 domain-containing protein [Candidatus Baltobacteraceae bacterium]
MKRTDVFLACVVLLCGASPMLGAAANPGTAPAASRAVEAYTGTIVSLNGQRYILRDDDNNVWYHLDDQQDASKFVGKKVLVVGRLDARTDVIHVDQIEEANK